MANHPIPNWALERYTDIEEYILYSMTILAETDQMKLLFSGYYLYLLYFHKQNIRINNYLLGEMLNDVLTRMEASINKSPNAKKIYLHVGHDSTIVPFLKTLNIKNITYPLYGAAVVMELYATISNETVVKVNNISKYCLCSYKLLNVY